MMLGHHAVHLVDEDDVGLAGREARLDELLEQAARIDGAADALVLRRAEVEFTAVADRSEEHTSELQSLMRISYDVFCLKKKKQKYNHDKVTLIHILYRQHSHTYIIKY